MLPSRTLLSSVLLATSAAPHLLPCALVRSYAASPKTHNAIQQRALAMSTQSPADQAHKDGSVRWSSNDGRFRRQESTFRDEIKKGGKFEPEAGRYLLIVAYACPWAHRTLIARQLKGIDDTLLPVYVVNSLLTDQGWTFNSVKGLEQFDVQGTGLIPGHEHKWRIRDFYLAADPEYRQRCTVPVIWDNKQQTIVNNESSEIIRFLNTAFDDFLPKDKQGVTFYPEDLKTEIDEFHSWVYPNINNGVYKCGFATSQEAYNENIDPLFASLDRVEKLPSDGRTYVFGDRLTEADIRLYTTIVRFDPVYVGHFKTNVSTVRRGYPSIHKWLRNLYWNNLAFGGTTHFDPIKAHYYASHTQINPHRIVPKGPVPHIEKL